jgi:hypothetical protein
MSKRKQRRKQPKRLGPPKPTRAQVANSLNRQPRRWDILTHQLAVALTNPLRRARTKRSSDPALCYDQQEAANRGLHLARTAADLIADRSLHGCWCPEPCPWHLDESSAESLAADLTENCFQPLLRKLAEDVKDMPPPRPHLGLDRLVNELESTTHKFLRDRSLPDGDLHACLADPLGDPEGYFPANGKTFVPETTGAPARDVYWLGPRIYDTTEVGDLKQPLVHFARTDPWLVRECMNYINDRLDQRQPEEDWDWQMHCDQATDDFLFSSTRLSGWSPLELFLARQHHLSEAEVAPLRRWQEEQFTSIFEIKRIRSPWVTLRDLSDEQRYEAAATKAGAFNSVQAGVVFVSRLVPWGNHWLLSGTQPTYPASAENLEEIRQQARHSSLGRHRPDDPQRQRAFKLQHEQHDLWLELFGDDEVLCEDGCEAEQVVKRFMQAWQDRVWQARPNTGPRPGDANGPPDARDLVNLSDELRAETDVGVIFHRDHGLTYLTNYGLFRQTFEHDQPPSQDELSVAREYLTDESVDYWVFERMRDRWPKRTEQLVKAVLQDECFELERDFDATLAKFKGDQMRRPPQPTVSVADSDEASVDGQQAAQA